MDAKDLRIEPAILERSNDASKYDGAILQPDNNKSHQVIGSNSSCKVEVPTARPCAVIGPDIVVPRIAQDSFPRKAPVEPWVTTDNHYGVSPDYPHKVNYQTPSRNISPRQTFQENMQRVMVPPRYSSLKVYEDPNFLPDRNVSLKNTKYNVPPESRYCEVPYNACNSEHRNIRSVEAGLTNVNSNFLRKPHGWSPSGGSLRPIRPYGATEPTPYQYSEYATCTGPQPMTVLRPRKSTQEEHGPMYPDPYYTDRFKPYPGVKELYPSPRYEYVNYSNPHHPPTYPPHKYDMQKNLNTHPYTSYPQIPVKYMDGRFHEPVIDGYQRQPSQPFNYNLPFRNPVIHSNFGPVSGNGLQNKMYSYGPDSSLKSIQSSKLLYDPKIYEYETTRNKINPANEQFYANDVSPSPAIKSQVMIPNYSSAHMHGIPAHLYYKKDTTSNRNYEYPHLNINNTNARFGTQYSPTAIAISPSDSNTSKDTIHTQGTFQEDYGYISQSSLASMRSLDSGSYRYPMEYLKRYDPARYALKNSELFSKTIELNKNTKSKTNLNLRQFLQSWNDDEENSDNISKDLLHTGITGGNNNTKELDNANKQDQLYVLGLVNVPSEELSKYEHIQKVSKLPENIKGYNSIELLNQFEEAIQSSNLSNYSSRDIQSSHKHSRPVHSAVVLPRPLSPLDVEAKITQSVIHKEVGCNFEIKPCSPKMLNVEIATPVQTVLDERTIEKVSNPMLESPVIIGNEKRRENCNVIKLGNKSTQLNEIVETKSCKMLTTRYPDIQHDTVKTNYSLQDLESSSGVCLASLPRLDNDIELNFPEVNQQFINDNKNDSEAIKKKDLPTLDLQEMVDTQANRKDDSHANLTSETVYPEHEIDKEFAKLSKYRKFKRGECKIKGVNNCNTYRTDSVIIKNPENIKVDNCREPLSSSIQINTGEQTFDSINCSIKEVISNKLSKNDGYDVAINFSLNGKKNCNNDTNPKITTNTIAIEPNICENTIKNNISNKNYMLTPKCIKKDTFIINDLEQRNTDIFDPVKSVVEFPKDNLTYFSVPRDVDNKEADCLKDCKEMILPKNKSPTRTNLTQNSNIKNKVKKDLTSCTKPNELTHSTIVNLNNKCKKEFSSSLLIKSLNHDTLPTHENYEIPELNKEDSNTRHCKDETMPAILQTTEDTTFLPSKHEDNSCFPQIKSSNTDNYLDSVNSKISSLNNQETGINNFVDKQQDTEVTKLKMLSLPKNCLNFHSTSESTDYNEFTEIGDQLGSLSNKPAGCAKQNDIHQQNSSILKTDESTIFPAHDTELNVLKTGKGDSNKQEDTIEMVDINESPNHRDDIYCCRNETNECKIFPKTEHYEPPLSTENDTDNQKHRDIKYNKGISSSVLDNISSTDRNQNFVLTNECANIRILTESKGFETFSFNKKATHTEQSFTTNTTTQVISTSKKLMDSFVHKELLSPWMQKLIMFEEGCCLQTSCMSKNSESDYGSPVNNGCQNLAIVTKHLRCKSNDSNDITIVKTKIQINNSLTSDTKIPCNTDITKDCFLQRNDLEALTGDVSSTKIPISHIRTSSESTNMAIESNIEDPNEDKQREEANHLNANNMQTVVTEKQIIEPTKRNYYFDKEDNSVNIAVTEDSLDIQTLSKIESEKETENIENKNIILEKTEHNSKRSFLKRSLSDSVLTFHKEYSCDNNINNELSSCPYKRQKFSNLRNDNEITFCHNNRRNSLTSLNNDENISFCILIEDNSMLEGDNIQLVSGNFQVPLECNDSLMELKTYSESESSREINDNIVVEKLHEHTWVADIDCIETIIDDIAEDIVISASPSPTYNSFPHEISQFDYNEMNVNHVKNIYGGKLCSSEAQFVVDLYNTPQMNVSRTLVSTDFDLHVKETSIEESIPLSTESCNNSSDDAKAILDKMPKIDKLYSFNSVDKSIDIPSLEIDSHDQKSNLLLKSNYDNAAYKKPPSKELKTDTQASVNNDLAYSSKTPKYIISSSPEVSSTTSEEKSGILLKIKNYKGSITSQNNDNLNIENSFIDKSSEKLLHCSSVTNVPRRLITKAAQKYIPPLKETIGDFKVRLPLPQHSLLRFKQLKNAINQPKYNYTEKNYDKRKDVSKKPKPKFEDVLKSIDEIQIKFHKEKNKKSKKTIPKVVIKKNENGSHYASSSRTTVLDNKYNPDLTGRKWQPWVFIEKNNFIDKMVLRRKTKAVYSYRKKTYVLAEKFYKYKSVNNEKFIISRPLVDDQSKTPLKYTIKLKQSYLRE